MHEQINKQKTKEQSDATKKRSDQTPNTKKQSDLILKTPTPTDTSHFQFAIKQKK